MPMFHRGIPAVRGVTAVPPVNATTTPDFPAAPAAQPGPSSIVTLARPQNNDGVSIRFDGRSWTSAGRSVPLQGSTFQRVGEYAGFAVYRQAGTNDDIIYVQTRDNVIAPFRLKP
jgi:hypothetical protein